MSDPLDAGGRAGLLAELGWVRAIARELVRGADAAEELVQDTCLVALQHPPRALEGPGLRAWLARVTRVLALRRWRGERARRSREEACARAEGLASAQEVHARAVMQRELVEAVLALGEPWSATLLLRYMDGLAPAEIARRQGVDAATVRKRCERALARLRERLDAGHAGRRADWLAGLALLARPPRLLSFGARSTGIWTMQASSKIAFASALALVVAFVGWRYGWESPGASRSAGAPWTPAEAALGSTSPTAAEPGNPLAAAGRALAREVAPARSAPGSTLVARALVLDERGRPLPGAELLCSGRDLPAARSDAAGAVELVLDASAFTAGESLQFELRAADHVPDWRAQEARFDRALELGTIRLALAGSLQGRVVDPAGQGCAGAEVVLVVPEGDERPPEEYLLWGPGHHRRKRADQADEEGRFRFDGLPLGAWEVHAHAPDQGWSASSVQRLESERTGAEVRVVLAPLTPAVFVRGRVVDSEHRPVAGASVGATDTPREVDEAPPRWSLDEVVSDAEGHFALALPAQRLYDLYVEPPRERSELGPAFRAAVPCGAPGFEIELGRARRSELYVHDSAGHPLTRYRALALCTSEGFPRAVSAEEHPDGRVSLIAPAREFQIQIEGEDFESSSLGPYDPEGAPGEIDVLVQRCARLHGCIRSGGRELAGAVVQLYRRPDPKRRADAYGFPATIDGHGLVWTTSDEHGGYSLPIRFAGEGIVLVDPEPLPIHLSDPLRLEPGTERVLDLDLPTPGAVRGHVRRRDGGEPSELVVLASRGEWRVLQAPVEPDGSYRFGALAPGRWMLATRGRGAVARSHGNALSGAVVEAQEESSPDDDQPWTLVVPEGDTIVQDLVHEERAASLHTRIEVDGQPARAFSMRMVEGARPWSWDLYGNLARSTDERGELDWSGLEPGSWKAVWRAAEGALRGLVLVAPLELAPGQRELVLRLASASVEYHGPTPAALISELGEGVLALRLLQTAPSRQALPAGTVRLVRPEGPASGNDPLGWAEVERFELAPGQAKSFGTEPEQSRQD